MVQHDSLFVSWRGTTAPGLSHRHTGQLLQEIPGRQQSVFTNDATEQFERSTLKIGIPDSNPLWRIGPHLCYRLQLSEIRRWRRGWEPFLPSADDIAWHPGRTCRECCHRRAQLIHDAVAGDAVRTNQDQGGLRCEGRNGGIDAELH